MSFLSDLFHGNVGNLGNDLAPSNLFSDFGSSAMNVLSNPLADVGIAASLALPFLAPEIGAGLGLGAATDVAAVGADTSLATAEGVTGGFAGVPLAGLDASTIDTTLSDAEIAALQASPGASAYGSTVPFTGATTEGSITGGTVGAGGVMDFSPSSVIAQTGGDYGSGIAGGTVSGGSTTDPAFLWGTTGVGNIPGQVGAGVTGGVPPAGAQAPGLLDQVGSGLSSIGNFLGSPAGKGLTAVAGVGGLAANLYSGYQQNKALSALNQQEKANAQAEANIANAATTAAQPILTSGTALQQYIQTGTLPQAFQTQLDQAVAQAKAQRIQAAATMGQSTDPLQNTALGQDLAAIDMQAQSQKANIEQTLQQAGAQMVQQANQLLSTGATATDIAAQLPIMVQNLDIKLAQMTSASIGAFAAAMNGGARVGGQQGGFSVNINPSTGAVS